MATSVTKTSAATLLDLPHELVVDIYRYLFDSHVYVASAIITVTGRRGSYIGSRLPMSHISTCRSLQDAISEALASILILFLDVPYSGGEQTKFFVDDLANQGVHPKFFLLALAMITKVEVTRGEADLMISARQFPSMKWFEVNHMYTDNAKGLSRFDAAIPGTATDGGLDQWIERVLRTT